MNGDWVDEIFTGTPSLPAAKAPTKWIDGAPPEGIEVAWLRFQYQSGDGEGGWDWSVKVVLGVLVSLSAPDEAAREPEWCESGDWKGESYGDSLYEDAGFITHWMPYAVPDAGDFGIRDPDAALGVALPVDSDPEKRPDFYTWTWDVEIGGGRWEARYGWKKPDGKVHNLKPLFTHGAGGKTNG